MSRVVIHTAKGPAIIKTKGGDTVAVCRCGLTTNEDGTCCGNHHKIEGEKSDSLYQYNEKLEREEIANDEECCGECCGACDSKPDVL
ncbi:MAG: hypothetical protein WCL07_00765 [bacterium]